jgi:hypothetical protein
MPVSARLGTLASEGHVQTTYVPKTGATGTSASTHPGGIHVRRTGRARRPRVICTIARTDGRFDACAPQRWTAGRRPVWEKTLRREGAWQARVRSARSPSRTPRSREAAYSHVSCHWRTPRSESVALPQRSPTEAGPAVGWSRAGGLPEGLSVPTGRDAPGALGGANIPAAGTRGYGCPGIRGGYGCRKRVPGKAAALGIRVGIRVPGKAAALARDMNSPPCWPFWWSREGRGRTTKYRTGTAHGTSSHHLH